jgi:predicted ATPase with chaperone activity
MSSHRSRCSLLGLPEKGQSRLARRLTTILPSMTLAEALEATRLHGVAGLTGRHTALVTTRPINLPPPSRLWGGSAAGQYCDVVLTCAM